MIMCSSILLLASLYTVAEILKNHTVEACLCSLSLCHCTVCVLAETEKGLTVEHLGNKTSPSLSQQTREADEWLVG